MSQFQAFEGSTEPKLLDDKPKEEDSEPPSKKIKEEKKS